MRKMTYSEFFELSSYKEIKFLKENRIMKTIGIILADQAVSMESLQDIRKADDMLSV